MGGRDDVDVWNAPEAHGGLSTAACQHLRLRASTCDARFGGSIDWGALPPKERVDASRDARVQCSVRARALAATRTRRARCPQLLQSDARTRHRARLLDGRRLSGP